MNEQPPQAARAVASAELRRPRPTRRRRATKFLLSGLAVILPTFLTGYIVFVCYRFVHTNLGYWIGFVLAKALGQWDGQQVTRTATVIAGDILAVVIVFGGAVVVGALVSSYIGRRVVRAGEHLLVRLPFVKIIYPYVKQITDFIFTDKSMRFRTVVAVPYPRRGMYSMGFVTGTGMETLSQATGEDMLHVFIPSSPTPVTGYVVFLPRREVVELPLTVEEALRFSISGGVIVPPHEMIAEALADKEPDLLASPDEYDQPPQD